jgi:hypothetical protein
MHGEPSPAFCPLPPNLHLQAELLDAELPQQRHGGLNPAAPQLHTVFQQLLLQPGGIWGGKGRGFNCACLKSWLAAALHR